MPKRIYCGSIIINSQEFIKNLSISAFIYLPEFFHFLFRPNLVYRFVLFLSFSIITVALLQGLKVKKIFTIPFLILSLFHCVYFLITGEPIMYQVVASIYETDYDEITEMVSAVIGLQIVIALVVGIILIKLIFVSRDSGKQFAFRKIVVLKTIGICLTCVIIAYFIGIKFRRVYPVSAIIYNIKYFNEIYHFKKKYSYLNYKFSGTIDSSQDLRETYLLVIGETARKASMSLYGYPRNTNPVLQHFRGNKASSVVVYTNAISASSFTRVSVPVMLSMGSAEYFKELASYPSIIKVFNAVGYKTFLISNQARRGFHNDVVSTIMNDVAYSIYLEDINTTDETYDKAVIPFLRYCMNDSSDKKLIIVHLGGSHHRYKKRYPPSHRFFKGDNLVATYDNSLRYTDYVLGEIINMIQDSDQAISMLYVSDHGENLNDDNDGNYGHGCKNFTAYELEIPLIFALNSTFVKVKISKVEQLIKHRHYAVSHDHVSHTLLGLAGIYDNQVYKESKDLTSSFLFAQARYVIDRDMNIFIVNLRQGKNLKTLSVK